MALNLQTSNSTSQFFTGFAARSINRQVHTPKELYNQLYSTYRRIKWYESIGEEKTADKLACLLNRCVDWNAQAHFKEAHCKDEPYYYTFHIRRGLRQMELRAGTFGHVVETLQ